MAHSRLSQVLVVVFVFLFLLPASAWAQTPTPVPRQVPTASPLGCSTWADHWAVLIEVFDASNNALYESIWYDLGCGSAPSFSSSKFVFPYYGDYKSWRAKVTLHSPWWVVSYTSDWTWRLWAEGGSWMSNQFSCASEPGAVREICAYQNASVPLYHSFSWGGWGYSRLRLTSVSASSYPRATSSNLQIYGSVRSHYHSSDNTTYIERDAFEVLITISDVGGSNPNFPTATPTATSTVAATGTPTPFGPTVVVPTIVIPTITFPTITFPTVPAVTPMPVTFDFSVSRGGCLTLIPRLHILIPPVAFFAPNGFAFDSKEFRVCSSAPYGSVVFLGTDFWAAASSLLVALLVLAAVTWLRGSN